MNMLVVPVVFVLFEIVMYRIFLHWTDSVKQELNDRLALVSSNGGSSEEGKHAPVVLSFGEGRKKAVWIFALILLTLFGMIAISVAFVVPISNAWLTAFVSAAFFCMVGLAPWLLFLESYGSFQIVTKNGIFKRSPWTGSAHVLWGQIESVRWIPILDNFLVRTDKSFFFVTPVFENLDVLAKAVMEQVPRDRWIGAERWLTKASAGPFQP